LNNYLDYEEIFTISNNVYRLKKRNSDTVANSGSPSISKGYKVKNSDFSYENFNLIENFKKPELDERVFIRIKKTVNLYRIFMTNTLRKYFVKWGEQMLREKMKVDDHKKSISLKTARLLSLWCEAKKVEIKHNMRESMSFINSIVPSNSHSRNNSNGSKGTVVIKQDLPEESSFIGKI